MEPNQIPKSQNQQKKYVYYKITPVPQNLQQQSLKKLFSQLVFQQFIHFELSAYYKFQDQIQLENKLITQFGPDMIYQQWNAKIQKIDVPIWNQIQQISKIKFNWVPKQPRCIKQKFTKIVCVAKDCKHSPYICQTTCECYIPHKKCKYANWQTILQLINEKMVKKTQEIEKMTEQIEKVFKQVLQNIQMEYQSFKSWKQSFGLKQSEAIFVTNLRQKQFTKIDGNFINSFYQTIDQKYSPLITPFEKIQKQKLEIIKKFENLRIKLKNLFIQNKKLLLENSQILQINKDSEFLHSLFPKSVKTLKLLFRASQNKFLASAFHKKCENISNTLVILQTQFGKIIGGFTPIPWKSRQGHSESDISKQSFLFSLTLKQKMPIINYKYAVYHYNLHGPAFGAGNDIFICDKANTIENSYCNFPASYSNNKYENNQQTYQKFSGQKFGTTFKIKEWEVYEVIFQ